MSSPHNGFARPPRIAAIKIALIYAIVGSAWIFFSDELVDRRISDEFADHFHVQTVKGCFFILMTAVMIYLLVRRTLTAARVSERARRESEAGTKLLVERVRDYAIFTLDEKGNIKTWNRGAQQITDWREEDVLGQNHQVFYPAPEQEAGKPKQDLEAARSEGWFEEEAIRIRQDGTEFWAHSQLTALRDEAGAPTGFLSVIRDVTESRRAQDALQQMNYTLAAVIDASPLAIVTLDVQANVRSWNPAAEQMFGWKTQEVLGQPMPIIPESEREAFEKTNKALLAGERIESIELLRQHKDGAMLELSMWTAPLRDAGGGIIGTVRLFADISERKYAEEQIRQLNETLERRVIERTAQLEEVNEELQAFSYTVSHDLRSPLRSLQQLARALLESQSERLDDQGKSDAVRVIGASARMERLIDDLLEFSRVSRGQIRVEPISLVLVIHELLGRLERDPSFHDAQVVVQEPLGWVMAHRVILQQVILNLLVNAVTFVAPGVRPAVRIRSEAYNGNIRLWIEDNGIGISQEDQDRIFHAFERLPAAEKYPGSGVGLTVARHGIERMGGHVGFVSGTGTGTYFWIELPKVEGSL